MCVFFKFSRLYEWHPYGGGGCSLPTLVRGDTKGNNLTRSRGITLDCYINVLLTQEGPKSSLEPLLKQVFRGVIGTQRDKCVISVDKHTAD